VPKLVGETKTQNDDIQSMSASVFLTMYPTLADFIMSVLKDAAVCTSDSRSAAPHLASETTTSPFSSLSETAEVESASRTVDITSSSLFPVLSLLCRLSPGLEVTDEDKK